jgi:hypothetical protein
MKPRSGELPRLVPHGWSRQFFVAGGNDNLRTELSADMGVISLAGEAGL